MQMQHSERSKQTEILILGAGPSGAAVALGLKKLGYKRIKIITQKRPFKAVEGISERVVEGLRNAGFSLALQHLPEPSPRFVSWNGVSNQANTEYLIDRTEFDQHMMLDLAHQGIELIQGRVVAVASSPQGYEVQVQQEVGVTQLQADFLVEARGRAAPAADLKRLRGEETVSLLQYWDGPAMALASAAQSFENGWGWFASDGKGRRYLQLTFDVKHTQLPKKAELVAFCNGKLQTLSQAQPFLGNAQASGEIHARTSTPILCEEAVGTNWIRVGDAAMSVDPMSGNGIFQTLSSSLQAPAVINTLLTQPDKQNLAREFHQSRITELFYRFARIGRDFYAMEQQWPDNPFWCQRRQWPDAQPIHQPNRLAEFSIAQKPVMHKGLIERAEVVVSPDQPLGIWRLAGLELAPVLRLYQQSADTQTFRQQLAELYTEPKQQQFLCQWLQQQGAQELG